MIVVKVRPDLVRSHRPREGYGPAGRRRTGRPGASRRPPWRPRCRHWPSSSAWPNPTRSTRFVAAATSATREADNGGDFIAEVEPPDRHPDRGHLRHGRSPADPSGRRLRRGHRRRPPSSIDIGGRQRRGHARQRHADDARPELQGRRIRLTERFVKSDPLSGRDERHLVKHLNREMGDYLTRSPSAASTASSERRARF